MKVWLENVFSSQRAGRPVHHQICVGCLHILLLYYIKQLTGAEMDSTYEFSLIVLFYCIILYCAATDCVHSVHK